MKRNVMWYVRIGALLGMSFLAISCQKYGAGLPNPNGRYSTITTDYPAVVKVILPNYSGMCTGTFVSPRAVLTAAHCALNAGTYTIVASWGTFTTSNRVKFGPGVVNDPNDIAFLYFNSNVANPNANQVMKIGNGTSSGHTVRLIGYGCNDLQTQAGSGVKRTGTNVVADISDYVDLITPLDSGSSRGILGPENRAGSCFGDSGGPAAETLNGELYVQAVAHAGGIGDDAVYSEYGDLGRNDNHNWIVSMNQTYSLGISGL